MLPTATENWQYPIVQSFYLEPPSRATHTSGGRGVAESGSLGDGDSHATRAQPLHLAGAGEGDSYQGV